MGDWKLLAALATGTTMSALVLIAFVVAVFKDKLR